MNWAETLSFWAHANWFPVLVHKAGQQALLRSQPYLVSTEILLRVPLNGPLVIVNGWKLSRLSGFSHVAVLCYESL